MFGRPLAARSGNYRQRPAVSRVVHWAAMSRTRKQNPHRRKGEEVRKLPACDSRVKEERWKRRRKKARLQLQLLSFSVKNKTPKPPPTCRRTPCPPASGEWTWTSTTRTNLWTRRTEEKTSWVLTRQRWTPSSDNILYMISQLVC